jgi:hypothetical protein
MSDEFFMNRIKSSIRSLSVRFVFGKKNYGYFDIIYMAGFKNSQTFCVLNSVVTLFLKLRKTAKTSII